MTQKDEWVSAADALKMLGSRFSSSAATRRICERANAGLVRARAEHFHWQDQSVEHHDIPKKFWWAQGELALEQDWAAGDFSTWINDVQFKAFGVMFLRADLEKLAPPVDPASAIAGQSSGQLYLQLAHLVETAPDQTLALTTEIRMWLAQVRAAVQATGDIPNLAALENAFALLDTAGGRRAIPTIHQCLYNALASENLKAPPQLQGAFVPAGNAHDALVAVGKILGTAKMGVMFVDPYADANVLDRYALFVPERVPIEILADGADVKATLKPAADAWIKQYASDRPLSIRLSAPKSLHDRLIIVDGKTVFTVGQSFNALAARAPTSINRMIDADAASRKIEAHREIWNNATVVV